MSGGGGVVDVDRAKGCEGSKHRWRAPGGSMRGGDLCICGIAQWSFPRKGPGLTRPFHVHAARGLAAMFYAFTGLALSVEQVGGAINRFNEAWASAQRRPFRKYRRAVRRAAAREAMMATPARTWYLHLVGRRT